MGMNACVDTDVHRAHSDFPGVRSQEILGNTSPSFCNSFQTNKHIPTSIYGASDASLPTGIWKSSDLGNLEPMGTTLENEGKLGAAGMDVWQNTLPPLMLLATVGSGSRKGCLSLL